MYQPVGPWVYQFRPFPGISTLLVVAVSCPLCRIFSVQCPLCALFISLVYQPSIFLGVSTLFSGNQVSGCINPLSYGVSTAHFIPGCINPFFVVIRSRGVSTLCPTVYQPLIFPWVYQPFFRGNQVSGCINPLPYGVSSLCHVLCVVAVSSLCLVYFSGVSTINRVYWIRVSLLLSLVLFRKLIIWNAHHFSGVTTINRVYQLFSNRVSLLRSLIHFFSPSCSC